MSLAAMLYLYAVMKLFNDYPRIIFYIVFRVMN